MLFQKFPTNDLLLQKMQISAAGAGGRMVRKPSAPRSWERQQIRSP